MPVVLAFPVIVLALGVMIYAFFFMIFVGVCKISMILYNNKHLVEELEGILTKNASKSSK